MFLSNKCPFELCYCVRYSCNSQLNQNTTCVAYSICTEATNHACCFLTVISILLNHFEIFSSYKNT